MNPLVNGAMLMLVMAGGHPAQTAPAVAVIPLHHLDANDVPGLVPATSGLLNMVVNYRDNSVVVRGDAATVKTVKAKILALDVQPVTYRITASVVRYRVEADGRYSESVVMSPTMQTIEKTPVRISVTTVTAVKNASEPQANAAESSRSSFAVQFTPSRNADGSITLLAEVQELGEQGEVIRSGRNERRIASGETAHVVGMTDAADKALRRRALKGDVVRDAGAYAGYYVQARAEMLDDKGQPVKQQP